MTDHARISELAAQLAAHLAAWHAHQPGPDMPACSAANEAIGDIDAMLRALHVIRARLTGEIRDSDDATDARVDAMLAAARPLAVTGHDPRAADDPAIGEPGDDPVIRRRAYEAQHPDTVIDPPGPGPGQTLWTASRNGAVIASKYWLGDLLDTLDHQPAT
jgi:hypothetical protein